MIYQLLGRDRDLDTAWGEFFDLNSLTRQRETTAVRARERIPEGDDLQGLLTLLDRIRRQASKRNAIVHGRWARIEVIDVDDDGREERRTTEYLRKHEPSNPQRARPRTNREHQDMRGKTRFDAEDMRRAEREFQQLGGDLFRYIERLIRYIAPRSL